MTRNDGFAYLSYTQLMQTTKLPIFTLLLLISFAAVNAVLFTPALPALANDFQLSDTVAQLTVTAYLVGYTLGQLLYGPLANRFGRKTALYIGISIQVLSSLACIWAGYAHSFNALVAARFVLALGAGVGLKVSVTMVNESYPPQKASQTISLLMLAFAIAPGLGVALGGMLTTHLGWISCFYAGGIYGLLLLALVTRLPETLKTPNPNALQWEYLSKAYLKEFSNPRVIIGGCFVGMCGCFLYIFAAEAPFIAIEIYGMNSQSYGFTNLIPLIGLGLGSIVSAALTQKYSNMAIIRFGMICAMVGVSMMLICVLLKLPVLISIFLTMFIINFGEVMVLANGSALAMTFASDKSHGSAVVNFIGVGLATVSVLLMGTLNIDVLSLPLIYIGLCLLSMWLYWKLVRS